MNIVLITGNNINEESGIYDFNYYENLKESSYIKNTEKFIENELPYKFPNKTHQTILNFIERNHDKNNFYFFDQSYFNFFENIKKDIEIIKLEGNIKEFRCLKCSKIQKTNFCKKCNKKNIHHFPIINDFFPNYEKLLYKIGMKKLMNLNFKLSEDGNNQPIWTLDTKIDEKIIIISIGVQDTLIPFEMYFEDIKKLDKNDIFNIYYLDNKKSEMKINYNLKIETDYISKEINNFLLNIEKFINLNK